MTLLDRACRIGTLARRLLQKAGQGRVLASCSGAIFLLNESGAILWIQGRDAPMHRRGIELPAATLPRVPTGARFRVLRERLWIAPSIRIGLERASLWEPVGPAATSRGLASRIRGLFDSIDAAPARELGTLIPLLRRLFEGGPGTPALIGDPVLDAAGPHAIGAALACRDRDEAALEGHVAALVGLGRGMTPSGDDFVGGLLFVLRRVPGLCPVAFVEGACSMVTSWADRTNAVSFAMLSDHAVGHGNAAEHEIVSSLCGVAPGIAPRGAVERLVRIGHSSGWDHLAGMVAALSALRQSA